MRLLRRQVHRQQEQLRSMQQQQDQAVKAEQARWTSTFEALVAEVRDRWRHCQQVSQALSSLGVHSDVEVQGPAVLYPLVLAAPSTSCKGGRARCPGLCKVECLLPGCAGQLHAALHVHGVGRACACLPRYQQKLQPAACGLHRKHNRLARYLSTSGTGHADL